MKKKKIQKKLISLVTVVSLLAAMLPVGVLASTHDVAGHWAEDYLTVLYEKDMLNSYDDGTLRPNQPITRAEFILMMNSVFGYIEKSDTSFTDITAGTALEEEMQKAVRAGYVSGYPDGSAMPDNMITRQEAARALYDALGFSPVDAIILSKFADKDAIGSFADYAVAALVEKGVIQGYPEDNTFRPQGNITRGEAAAIVMKFAREIVNVANSVHDGSGNRYESILVNAPDVTLSNMTVVDLYIAPGVDEGEVTLDNVTVEGTVYVQGGGSNSIIFRNSRVKNLDVRKQNNKPVRIVAEGSTSVGRTALGSSTRLDGRNLTGTNSGFQSVEVKKDPVASAGTQPIILVINVNVADILLNGNVNLDVQGGVIGTISILEDIAIALNVAAGATVSKVESTAEGATVTIIAAEGAVIVNITGASDVKLNGDTIPAGTDTSVAPDSSTDNTGGGNTGGGGGGGGGGGDTGGGNGGASTQATAQSNLRRAITNDTNLTNYSDSSLVTDLNRAIGTSLAVSKHVKVYREVLGMNEVQTVLSLASSTSTSVQGTLFRTLVEASNLSVDAVVTTINASIANGIDTTSDNFTEELSKSVTAAVNKNVTHGSASNAKEEILSYVDIMVSKLTEDDRKDKLKELTNRSEAITYNDVINALYN